MYMTRIIEIRHKTAEQDDVNAFNEYIESLVTTINHTPYIVRVVEAWETGNVNDEECRSNVKPCDRRRNSSDNVCDHYPN